MNLQKHSLIFNKGDVMQQENIYVGITFDKHNPKKPWRARYYRERKSYYVGRFATRDEAKEARDKYIANFNSQQNSVAV